LPFRAPAIYAVTVGGTAETAKMIVKTVGAIAGAIAVTVVLGTGLIRRKSWLVTLKIEACAATHPVSGENVSYT
jgi:hypothetical protein